MKSRMRNYFITLCLYYKNKLPAVHSGRWINSNLLYKHVVANNIPYEDWKVFILQQLNSNTDQWLDANALGLMQSTSTEERKNHSEV